MGITIYNKSELPDEYIQQMGEEAIDMQYCAKIANLKDEESQKYIENHDKNFENKPYMVNINYDIKLTFRQYDVLFFVNNRKTLNPDEINRYNEIETMINEIKLENVPMNTLKVNMYTNYYVDLLPEKDDVLIYKDLENVKFNEFKSYIKSGADKLRKFGSQFKSKVKTSIRGNLFGKKGTIEGNNLIYNYCSNISYYNNKKYAYNYKNSDEKYYMLDDKTINNYDNKKRINTRELEQYEREAQRLIEKLTSGTNIVAYNNNKNLNTASPLNIFEIFTGDDKRFRLEWKNNSNSDSFKNGLLINIKTADKTFNKLNITLTTDIFEKYNMKKKKQIVDKFTIDLEKQLSNIEPKPHFVEELDSFTNIPAPPPPTETNTETPAVTQTETPDETTENTVIRWDGIEEKTTYFDPLKIRADECEKMYTYPTKEETECNIEYKYNLIHKNTYIDNSIENLFNSSNELEELCELYIRNIIPIYGDLSIQKYNWKIEFEGDYIPNITEIHLKSLYMNKYLITKEENDNTVLEWSDTIVKNSGWKFIDNMTPPRVNYEPSKLEEYRNSVKEIIKNKFKELFIANTQDLFNKKNEEHSKVIKTKTDCFNDYLNKKRINKINDLNTKGCYIFSPNIGQNGKFLKYTYSTFSWTNNINDKETLFYINKHDKSTTTDSFQKIK